MRSFLLFCSFLLFQTLFAENPYRTYLLAHSFSVSRNSVKAPITLPQRYLIPRYQIPKGAVFCRMEDKLTKATGLWIKIGLK